VACFVHLFTANTPITFVRLWCASVFNKILVMSVHEFTKTCVSHGINKSWWINVYTQRARWRFM